MLNRTRLASPLSLTIALVLLAGCQDDPSAGPIDRPAPDAGTLSDNPALRAPPSSPTGHDVPAGPGAYGAR